MRNQYTLLRPIDGVKYGVLINALLTTCSWCSVVVRDFDQSNKRVQAVLQYLDIHRERTECVSEWPGTRLAHGGTADLHWYALSPALADILKAQGGLFSWISPDAPEDLCFYRSDRSFLLAAISHERDAFLDVDDEELAGLRQAVPTLEVVRDSATNPEN